MKIGDRVRIGTLENWANGSAEKLQGMTGTLSEYWPRSRLNVLIESPYLVMLDVAPEKWWEHQQPSREWWFKESELEVI